MILTQERLSTELSRRMRAAREARGELWAAAHERVDPPDIEAARAAPEIRAIVVIRNLNITAFARSSLAFAFALPAAWRRLWFGAFTRTIFLAGNPDNLARRFPFQHIAADGSSAWLGPASPQLAMTLRRLLVLFRPSSVACPTSGFPFVAPFATGDGPCTLRAGPRIYVATAGLDATDYLVHLNHTLAESAIMGLIVPGSFVTVRHVPRLHTCPEELAWVRVHRDDSDADRLRAYTGVSTSH